MTPTGNPMTALAALERMMKSSAFDAGTPREPTEQEKREAAERKAEGERIAVAAARVFDTVEGQQVLEWLADWTVRRPTHPYVPGRGMEEMALYGAMREGQNAIFVWLYRLIEAGRRTTPADPASPPPA